MPLEIFAERASRTVAELLEEAGIEIVTGRVPHMLKDGRLGFEDGGYVDVERVVASPELRVPRAQVARGRREAERDAAADLWAETRRVEPIAGRRGPAGPRRLIA
jgi:hypothetical protein